MKLFVLFSTGLTLSLLLHLSLGDEGAAPAPEKKPVKKLQIGVKKRVENCDQKSRRGDLLSMHYTVSQFTFNTRVYTNLQFSTNFDRSPDRANWGKREMVIFEKLY